MGLGHTSVGEGKTRHIQVTKQAAHNGGSPAVPQDKTDEELTGIKLEPSASHTAGTDADERSLNNSDTLKNKTKSEAFEDDNCRVEGAVEDLKSVSTSTAGEVPNTELYKSSQDESSAVLHDDGTDIIDSAQDKSQQVVGLTEGSVSVVPLPQREVSSSASELANCQGKDGTGKEEDGKFKSIQDLTACSYCEKKIPKNNIFLHELHCSKQTRPSSQTDSNRQNGPVVGMGGGGGGGKGARKKENMKRQELPAVKEKKEKQKPKVSHVQKASEALKKIDNDDFEALISTITALDGQCAFRKCKTLTTTLGQKCNLCDRRFCLAHLTPEIHGCGAAAKDQARRTISREGVLHSGSGVPDKKPNAARRAQLELKMDKKKEELAKVRARKGDKKKS
ncbi:DNA-binding protein smubp-2 [Plakobranchus ocellatus]|uniref:DNA-binding protein smubp-2 n=1 Tax=Plakobranchus ocellatus TaxID=259542 RepID=A0AAV4A931_9GAST|nr:DNA-binding protein smubp-2 [Plakobranchus ocellatus]